jgi:hypothetical protein
MNRNDLISQTQLNIKTLNEVLEGLGISKDLEDFTDEYLKLVQTIQEIRKDEKVQSWSEAIAVYRKPIREGQLTEAAARHQIAPERIPEILSALKLKPETLTDAQLEQFAEVCAKLQTGVELAAAVPAKATRGKKAAAVPEFVPQSADEDAGGGAMLTLHESALATPSSITALEVSETDQATLRDVADAAAKAAVTVDISDKAAELAVDVVDQIDGVLRQMIVESIFGENSQVKPDPERAAARVREIRAQRGQR